MKIDLPSSRTFLQISLAVPVPAGSSVEDCVKRVGDALMNDGFEYVVVYDGKLVDEDGNEL